jgi:hypothetical protein
LDFEDKVLGMARGFNAVRLDKEIHIKANPGMPVRARDSKGREDNYTGYADIGASTSRSATRKLVLERKAINLTELAEFYLCAAIGTTPSMTLMIDPDHVSDLRLATAHMRGFVTAD